METDSQELTAPHDLPLSGSGNGPARLGDAAVQRCRDQARQDRMKMAESKLPANMQEFHQITTLVFAELYVAFPMRKKLSPDEIAGKLGLSDPEAALPSGRKFNEVFHHTVAWLQDEGYVQGQSETVASQFGALTTVHFGPIEGLTLTSKALVVMNVVPTSLSGSTSIEPLGQQILTAATDTSSAQGNTVIQSVMGRFFGSIAKSS